MISHLVTLDSEFNHIRHFNKVKFNLSIKELNSLTYLIFLKARNVFRGHGCPRCCVIGIFSQTEA